jgi:1-acyl-sn-glycerol-3-phosphate acyltransferase
VNDPPLRLTPRRVWRALRSGVAFGSFGLLGLGLGLVVFPLERLRSRDRETAERRSQAWVGRVFRFFIRLMDALGLVSVRFVHPERLREPGTLVVANHPTLLDVVMIGSQMPQVDCIVKREAWRNPFMRHVVVGTGYIPNDLGEPLIDACVERLRRGRSLLVFPEGTRSPAAGLGRFARGAAHVVVADGRPLTPVVVRCTPPALMRGQRWYAIPDVRLCFEIEACEPLAFDALVEAGASRAQASRQITRALRDFYEKRLHTPASE